RHPHPIGPRSWLCHNPWVESQTESPARALIGEMTRSALLVLVLAACGNHHSRTVAKYSAPGDGTCRAPNGCAAWIPEQPEYRIPDSDHPPPGPGEGGEVKQASCADV